MQKTKKVSAFVLSLLVAFTAIALPVMAEEADLDANETIIHQQIEATAEKPQRTDTEVSTFAVQETEQAAAFETEETEDLLLDYMEQEVSISSEPKTSQAGRNHLSGLDRKLYDILRSNIEQVASGAKTSTEFYISLKNDLHMDPSLFERYSADDLGVEAVVYKEETDGNVYITEEAKRALMEKLGDYNLDRIHHALLFDCPADLYWYDKVAGVKMSFTAIRASYSVTNLQSAKVFIPETAEFGFRMTVASEYASGTYKTNIEKITAVRDAIQNAQKIVRDAALMDDYHKLLHYKDAICEAVSYNRSAASGGTSYGNPWQMIWVFDGDSDTNVVCEGYSKAFQFLCDASSFLDENIKSRIVSGSTSGPHMWNLVTMEDGKTYLADITNSDSGTIGQNGGLFLAGLAADAEMTDLSAPFWIPYKSGVSQKYMYDTDTKSNYFADELLVTSGAYKPVPHKSGEPVVENNVEPECEKPGSCDMTVFCTVCGKKLASTHVEKEKLGHSFTNFVSNHDATCFLKGTKTAKCDRCTATKTVVDDSSVTGHSLVHVAAKASTTTEQGNIECWRCSACGRYYLERNDLVDIDPAKVKLPLLKKKTNPMAAKAKIIAAVKASKLRYKALLIKRKYVVAVSKAKGTVTFQKRKGSNKILVAANGNIILKKGLKAGTYKLVVRVKAAGTTQYAAGKKDIVLTIRIK